MSSVSYACIIHIRASVWCQQEKKIVTVSVTLFLSNLVRSGLSVITYLHFSSGFGGVLNLSRLSVKNQMAS